MESPNGITRTPPFDSAPAVPMPATTPAAMAAATAAANRT
jgi:hypothetical protein